MVNRSEADLVLIFAHNLRRFREAKGLSQEQLAYGAGLDRTYVSSCERGQRNVTLRSLQRLADGLGVSVIELLGPLDE